MQAPRDQNHVPSMLLESSSTPGLTITAKGDEVTGRLLVDSAAGSGTVTSVSVVTANGFAGSVANATTTPAITISTTITGILKGNGTAISAATAGTDYVTASSTNTFTNKTYDTAGTGNSFSINGTSITAVTGTGAVVLATSPTLVTPNIGAATATSVNGLTITASTGTLTIANGKTLTVSNSLTFAGTDGNTFTFPSGSDTVVTLTATQELDNKTLDSSVGKGTWTASGTWTLPAVTLGGAVTLANVFNIGENGLLLDPALSADGTYSGITEGGTAGATLAFGDLIYLDPTDSRWELCDANAAAGADGDSRGNIGICVLAAAADGDPTTILRWGKVRADTAFPSMTVNNPLYVSETAGDITGTQPTTTDVVIRVVGFAKTADELFFYPSSDYITHT